MKIHFSWPYFTLYNDQNGFFTYVSGVFDFYNKTAYREYVWAQCTTVVMLHRRIKTLFERWDNENLR